MVTSAEAPANPSDGGQVALRRRRPVGRGRIRRPVAATVAVVVVALLVSACDPVSHPVFTPVEPNPGPVSFQLLSGDGNFVVVHATGAGATVPGAGNWRVDRRDGTAVALPDAYQFLAISDDGQRVAYLDPGGFQRQLWINGTVVTPPPGTVMSRDLRWGAFIDFFVSQARRWDATTGAMTAVEAGIPRPIGHPTMVWNKELGVSDDGHVVWFTLEGPTGCLTRFVNLAFPSVNDYPYCDMEVAANGAAHVRLLDRVSTSGGILNIGGPRRLELVSTYTGTVQRTLTTTYADAYFDGVILSDSGAVIWTVEATLSGSGPPCGGIANPCSGSLTAREAIAASPTELARFPVDPDLVRGDMNDPLRFTVASGGRFLVAGDSSEGGSAHVLDRMTGVDEALADSSTNPKAVPAISADGRVVAYAEHVLGYPTRQNWRGWFEHESDAPGL